MHKNVPGNLIGEGKALCFGRAFFCNCCNLCVIFYAEYGIISF